MYETSADQGLVVISVVVQTESGDTPTTEDAAYWQDELGLTFMVLADVDGMLPTTAVVDPAGVVRWHDVGGSEDALL